MGSVLEVGLGVIVSILLLKREFWIGQELFLHIKGEVGQFV